MTYWIGGGSGAGKSTVARRLAARYGLRRYDTDAAMTEHAARTDAHDAPLLHAFLAMDMNERWADREPQVMLETFPWFHGEAFDEIVTDLEGFADRPATLVEGFRLLPERVLPVLREGDAAVWLLPTPEFRVTAFDARGSTWQIPRRTGDPERALRNLLERDLMFTDRLRHSVDELDLPHVIVDGTATEDELTTEVARLLGLHGGPLDGEGAANRPR